MIKIAHIGDLHLCGKNYDRLKEALESAYCEMSDRDVDILVCSGDVFDKANIADSHKTVGDLQGLFLDFIEGMPKVFVLEGNHDQKAGGLSALQFLRGRENVEIVSETRFEIIEDGPVLFFIPWGGWTNLSIFDHLSKVGWDAKGIKPWKEAQNGDLLAFEDISKTFITPSILFGHLNIVGTKVNEYYTVGDDANFSFTEEELRKTRANYMSFSHIHKRDRNYVGALIQTNFGEEGNPQGFDVITVDEGEINEEYVEIYTKKHKTFDIYNSEQFPSSTDHIRKIRFKNKGSFDAAIEKKKILESDMVVCDYSNSKRAVPRVSEKLLRMDRKTLLEKFYDIAKPNIEKEFVLKLMGELNVA